jgi:hypothetical protein
MGRTCRTASAIDFVSASQLYATFDLAGASAGSYTLSLQYGTQVVTTPTSFQVVAAQAEPLQFTLTMPQAIHSGRTGTVVINYTNSSTNDVIAPLLNVSSTNPDVSFSTPDDTNNDEQTAQILAVAPTGPAGLPHARRERPAHPDAPLR